MQRESDREINELIEKYRKLEDIVDEKLHNILSADGNSLLHITHRIKTLYSIKGKLERKPDLYSSIYDMRDILGFRVICYFSSDMDRAAELISKAFRVDFDKSKDKRKLIDARSFGYQALHYICALNEDEGELSNLWFEIQIKTILQHSWAEIEHDLGYKVEVEVPRSIRRSFSRAASLLETTDIIFSEIKEELEAYSAKVRESIRNETLDELYFDRITLTEFTAHNKKYRELLEKIAGITNAHITEGSTENQLPLIEFLNIHTLEDMIHLIDEEGETALRLAEKSLRASELDELSSTVAYYYLFRAKLINGDYSRERIREFFALTSKNEKTIENNTEKILNERENR
ncbi:MAG: hypothetical protein IJ608_09030 [Lachnospiraceae bacterium]|nr:hypothetical protein [Lachnospiraceae bacterium]